MKHISLTDVGDVADYVAAINVPIFYWFIFYFSVSNNKKFVLHLDRVASQVEIIWPSDDEAVIDRQHVTADGSYQITGWMQNPWTNCLALRTETCSRIFIAP